VRVYSGSGILITPGRRSHRDVGDKAQAVRLLLLQLTWRPADDGGTTDGSLSKSNCLLMPW